MEQKKREVESGMRGDFLLLLSGVDFSQKLQGLFTDTTKYYKHNCWLQRLSQTNMSTRTNTTTARTPIHTNMSSIVQRGAGTCAQVRNWVLLCCRMECKKRGSTPMPTLGSRGAQTVLGFWQKKNHNKEIFFSNVKLLSSISHLKPNLWATLQSMLCRGFF